MNTIIFWGAVFTLGSILLFLKASDTVHYFIAAIEMIVGSYLLYSVHVSAKIEAKSKPKI